MSIPSSSHSSNGKPRLILHTGPHKTGTTALQKTLSMNACVLEQHGWNYLEKFDCGLSVHEFADSLSIGQINRTQEALNQIMRPQGSMILSSENFSRLNEGQIKVLAQALEKYETSVVYYIRSPLKRLYSAWQEWVKHGYYFSFPEYMCARLTNFLLDPEVNDAARLDSWAAAFSSPNVQIFNFDATEDVPMEFFKTVLGFEPTHHPQERINKSFELSYVETIRASRGAYMNIIKLQDRNHNLWKTFNELEREISQLLAEGRYLCSMIGSADRGPFAILEENILTKFSHVALQNGSVFRERTVHWHYVDPNIWIDEPSLSEKMHCFREAVSITLGTAATDRRLSII